jgi:hypothetical protein
MIFFEWFSLKKNFKLRALKKVKPFNLNKYLVFSFYDMQYKRFISNSKINIIFAKMDLKLIEKTRMEFEISFC